MAARFLLRFLGVFAFLGLALVAGQNESALKKPLVAHEWGTFTVRVDSTGKVLSYRAFDRATDLPKFVNVWVPKSGGSGTVRMETPVIYFYSERKTTLSVHVDFPKGQITEFYPYASNHLTSIEWKDCTLHPEVATGLIVEAEKPNNHYYQARETDSTSLQVRTQDGRKQQEKFLFYRGVGTFDLPVSASLAGNQVTLKNTGSETISQAIVFENRGGKIGYAVRSLAGSETVIERPALDQSLDRFQSDLKGMLVAAGLYEREALAMVNTWRDTWSEEGLRVFYLIPRATTDQIIPISITPQPAELVRVMVGRLEIVQ